MGNTFGLKKFAVSGERTARLVLDSVSEDPKNPIALELRHAGESNRAFMSAAFKGSSTKHVGRTPTLAAWNAAREEDAELFAKYVVVGWENVALNGELAKCTPETVEHFLIELIEACPEVFDAIRTFARNPDNFRDPAGSAEALGKG